MIHKNKIKKSIKISNKFIVGTYKVMTDTINIVGRSYTHYHCNLLVDDVLHYERVSPSCNQCHESYFHIGANG